MNRTLRTALAAGLLGLGAAFAAAAPTDEQVRQAVDSFTEWAQNASPEEAQGQAAQQARQALSGIEIGELSAFQIDTLLPLLLQDETLRRQAQQRLASLADDTTAEGAAARVADAALTMYGERQPPDVETIRQLITHPGLGGALRQGAGAHVFAMMQYTQPQSLGTIRDEVLALRSSIGEDLPPMTAAMSMAYWGAVSNMLGEGDRETREEVRKQVAAAVRSAATRVDREEEPELAEALDAAAAEIDGAFARGELLGHQAPELEFIWTSSGHEFRRLSDLKGKVVVLDFWATWCGPCVASFPKVRELREHYADSPVVIVGVTSLQGRHIADNEMVSTEGDPDKEFALMADYIESEDITWPIAFSKQPVFNPEYGIKGIPHMVIIDPDGVVRHRGLHPAAATSEKTEKIDAILKEFDLPAPKG